MAYCDGGHCPFDGIMFSILWYGPLLIIWNGPPANTNRATLSELGRHARGADAKEKSERGAV